MIKGLLNPLNIYIVKSVFCVVRILIITMYVFVDTNMKLMFNKVGGRKSIVDILDCKNCVFVHSAWCTSLRLSHPFYRWCGNEIYRETSLDIFDL